MGMITDWLLGYGQDDAETFDDYADSLPDAAYNVQLADLEETVRELRRITNKQAAAILALVSWIQSNRESWINEFPFELSDMAYSLQVPQVITKKGKRK